MILLVGFEKFGKFSQNLSKEVVKFFPDNLNKTSIMKIILPVSWDNSIICFKEILNSLESFPDLIFILGIHTRKKVQIERYAWNWAFGIDELYKFKIGFIKFTRPFRAKTVFNLNRLVKFNTKQNFLSISHNPGFFLCNYIYYWALVLSKEKFPVLFMHIPQNGNRKDLICLTENLVKQIITVF